MKKQWTILIFVTIVWIICTALYVGLMPVASRFEEAVKFLAVWVPVYGIVSSTILMMFSYEETRKTITDRYEFDKNENTFKFMERWDMPSLKDARDITRNMKEKVNELNPTQLKAEINSNEGLKRSVITMCNFFEEAYLSIQYKRVNEKLLKDTFGLPYLNIFKRFENWLLEYLDKETMSHLLKLKRMWEPAETSPE